MRPAAAMLDDEEPTVMLSRGAMFKLASRIHSKLEDMEVFAFIDDKIIDEPMNPVYRVYLQFPVPPVLSEVEYGTIVFTLPLTEEVLDNWQEEANLFVLDIEAQWTTYMLGDE